VCTVSIIETPSGYRMAHSRDEQRSRRPGEPPAVRINGGVRVVSPRDPDAGGTWLAAREDGLTLAIMNVNPGGGAPRGERSRGLIVRDLAESIPSEPRGPDIAGAVGAIEPSLYSPFRLVAVWLGVDTQDPVRAAAWAWRGARGLEREDADLPACWATSGLGDSVVRARLPLFDEMVAPDPTPASQDAFHRHRWPDRGPESVLMSRPDARTVSISTVETARAETGTSAGPASVRMTYTEIPEEGRPDGAADFGPAEVITLR